jgi:hypothetical protein
MALEGVRGQRHAPAALYPRERPGTHCTGGWVGPRAGLDRCGKSRPPTEIQSPDNVDGKPGNNYIGLLFVSRIFIMDNHLFHSKLRE